MKICAVVVTYNRLKLLRECINALQHQTHPLDEIIVVNNHSTDGTTEWLAQQAEITVINQENLGGSGGFYTGTRYAYLKNYDWIWIMDDDVAPRTQCLEQLIKKHDYQKSIGILQPLRLFNNQPILLESIKLNLSKWSKPLHKHITRKDIAQLCKVEAIPFEGPLINCKVFSKIGFPNKDLFIFYDDTDFARRTSLAGFDIVLVPDAIIDKKLFSTANDPVSLSWKRKYEIRNSAYFDKQYGLNPIVRYVRPIKRAVSYCIYCMVHKRDFTLKTGLAIFKYTYNGLKGKLGKI